MSKVHKYTDSSVIGKLGEAVFMKNFPGWIKIGEGYTTADFKNDKHTLELKTDSYDIGHTPNFFMEYISNINKGTLGGPFRDPTINFFVYYFYNSNVAYWFDTQTLVNELYDMYDDIESNCITIKNEAKDGGFFYTRGLLVPRIKLKHCTIRRERWNKNV
jgi:hypothetical protein